MTIKKHKYPYYLATPVMQSLLKAKKKVLFKDWDRVYIIDGPEGSGKSTLALQLGYFLDRQLSIDDIVFTGRGFSNKIDKATKGQCIIFDEAFNGLSSYSGTSKLNKLLVRKLQECRQKNLFIIIVLPTIFLLQKYAAIFRSKALFHVMLDRQGNRGYYKVYNTKLKEILYLEGNKYYSYFKPKLNIIYKFGGKFPPSISKVDYKAKKLKALINNEGYEEVTGKKHKTLKDIIPKPSPEEKDEEEEE